MNPDQYASSSERRRLRGRIVRRGSQSGLSTAGAILFGSPFVATGILVILVGTRILPVDPTTVDAPYWILTVFGAVFVIAGLMIWGMARRQFVANRRRADAVRQYGNDPALGDYAWNPTGFDAPRWTRALGSLFAAAFVTLFLSMFNWWAFSGSGPIMLKAIVLFFDLILLAAWWAAAVTFFRAVKFGGSRILFARFPYRLPERILIRWTPASGIVRVTKGSFTLRCAEEWFETIGAGRNRSRHLVHEELWSGTWSVEQPQTATRGEIVELQFDPPGHLPPTCLNGERPVFWEFEVKLDLPGLDFHETYLVPVYAAPATVNPVSVHAETVR